MTKTFPVLETERLFLREMMYEDSPDILSYLSDTEVMKYYGMAPFKNIDEAREEISWYKEIYSLGSGIRWGITIKGSSTIIGSCGFHDWNKRHFRAEIGVELSRNYWRTGIMSEALTEILSYGFHHMGLKRIQALIEPENEASQKLFEKMGFQKEGLLRSYEFTVGKFDDLYMFAKIK